MEARAYWDSYVAEHGGVAKVSQRLEIPYPTIACVTNGSRGIGKSLARRMAAKDPSLDESILIWVESVKGGDIFGPQPDKGASDAA